MELLGVPGWKRFAWLRAGFSQRAGGTSAAYGALELNLGWTAEDQPEAVRANRAAFAQGVAGGLPMVTVSQVHGTTVRDLELEPAPWMTPEGRAVLEGDGLLSRTPGQLLAILTADCVPVLVADTRTHAVGAFHAGWRGTLGGIVRQGIARMTMAYGSAPEDLVAAVGPCIRSCCFVVGGEVRAAFREAVQDGAAFFAGAAEPGRWHMDLVAANVQQLRDAGVRTEAIAVVGGCTACALDAGGRRQFFSYRAEGGRTGRMLSAIGALA